MREWTEPISKSAAAFARSCSASLKSRSVNVGVTVAGVTVLNRVIQSARAARCCRAWAFSRRRASRWLRRCSTAPNFQNSRRNSEPSMVPFPS